MFAKLSARAASRLSRASLKFSRSNVAKASFVVAGAGVCLSTSMSLCHGTHHHSHSSEVDSARIEKLERQVAQLSGYLEDVRQTSGQGDMVFSWDQELTAAFPQDARVFEKDMHGGFSEDSETGIVYTGIPGYGLCQISPDLKTWEIIGTDKRLKDNIHGMVVFQQNGKTKIALAQNEHERVLIVDVDGNVIQELGRPKGGEFQLDEANAYYSHRPIKTTPWAKPHTPAFAVTDVTYLDGLLYAVAGYCDGDFVVTAKENKQGEFAWGPIAWGGRGTAPGKFQTAHGVFAYDDHIFVANREAHQVIEFTKTGQLVRCLPDIPDNARICNVAHAGNYFIFNALEPIPATPAKTAAIYAHTGDRLASTIEPGQLGIPILKHLHHTWPHYVNNKDGSKTLYLLIHGWSAGKYAVLKHEPTGKASIPNGWNRTQDRL